ncbi:uncharacterized protein LOC107272341 [Cephus cinctus]|uniref:Uncharacterized protein LOC107272341 n=1 Tax=Cephus cinctus TaxID=211228 RepID=A0AAJ7CAB9_CEPCN|nr:uncharacterized protein LOC107272341 [Cephus cinctus]
MKILLILALTSLARCSLLEMSQVLWTKLLAGGITKFGTLDPLRVPVIKVDQSEGDTRYRIVLRNLEVKGFNESVLESVHIARGRLKSNLSDFEAGYVSYNELKDLDSIRYRFHTLVKEPKNATGPGRYIDRGTQLVASNESLSKVQEQEKEESKNIEKEDENLDVVQNSQSHHSTARDPNAVKIQKILSTLKSQEDSAASDKSVSSGNLQNSPANVHVVYAQSVKVNSKNTEVKDLLKENSHENSQGVLIECSGSCNKKQNPSRGQERYQSQIFEDTAGKSNFDERVEDVDVSASESLESKEKLLRKYESSVSNNTFLRGGRRYQAAINKNQFNVSTDNPSSTIPLEKRPGYVDIIYADRNDQKVKHFGNLKIDSDQNIEVYSLDDIIKVLRENRRYIIHNFTEGESLLKRNNLQRIAQESDRIKDLIRYAKNYQEKDGYYEEGMRLIYHYGGVNINSKKIEDSENEKSNEARRRKRDQTQNESEEDDVMHVILKIHVPLLHVKAGYVLTGKVGEELLRGNGLLDGNFTDLTGDFTLELKRIEDTSEMIVRAARARLTSRSRQIHLDGMDDKGPVKSILVHGLMAAEAVAAMLADDLASKALSEKMADSMIYKMYKTLPIE